MPKLREPSTLEDQALGTLEKYVVGVIRCAASRKTPREICIEGLHKFLHADLPITLSHKVTDHICHSLEIFHERKKEREQKVITDVILASLSPHLEILDMTKLPTYAYETLTEYMHKFKKLHTLIAHLTRERKRTGLIVSGLSSLKFLVKFQMKRSCTDAVIIILVHNNYETIELIDVRNSGNITDASFKSLMKCHKLRGLLISRTSMTVNGYMEFLQYKMYDDTARLFVNLSVGCLSKKGLSSRELEETAATCPMLRELEIANLRENIGKLCDLTELEKVKIGESDFLQCNVDNFLPVRGGNLVLIELVAVTSLDFTCIVNHCVNLEELFLYRCSITDIVLGNERTAKSFRNLEKLYMDGNYPLSEIEYILSYCIEIRRFSLYLRVQDNVTDELILSLLRLPNFQKLKNFDFCSLNNNLSIKSVNAIIKQCPLLEQLSFVHSWRGVTNEQINKLRKKIKDNNLDLCIDDNRLIR